MTQSSNAPSQRQLRVGEQLRHIITETLQRGKFHDIVLLDHAPSVTVTEVKVAPDLKYAKAFVMSLRGNNMDDILPALNECAGYFQKEIARLDKKLSNQGFLSKAPAAVVEKEKGKLADYQEKMAALTKRMEDLAKL